MNEALLRLALNAIKGEMEVSRKANDSQSSEQSKKAEAMPFSAEREQISDEASFASGYSTGLLNGMNQIDRVLKALETKPCP